MVWTKKPGYMHLAFRAIRAGMYVTSHSAQDKAHWFLPDRQKGKEGAVSASQGQERNGEKVH